MGIPLLHWPPYFNTFSDLQRYPVAYFITSDRTWDFNALLGIFSAEMITLVSSLVLTKGDWADQLIWATSRSSHITSKDMSSALYPHHHVLQTHSFIWIWHLFVPMRVK